VVSFPQIFPPKPCTHFSPPHTRYIPRPSYDPQNAFIKQAAQYVQRLVANLCPRTPGFGPSPVPLTSWWTSATSAPFSPMISVFLPSDAFHQSSSYHYSCQKDKRTQPGILYSSRQETSSIFSFFVFQTANSAHFSGRHTHTHTHTCKIKVSGLIQTEWNPVCLVCTVHVVNPIYLQPGCALWPCLCNVHSVRKLSNKLSEIKNPQDKLTLEQTTKHQRGLDV
jgi:hypothetical protein